MGHALCVCSRGTVIIDNKRYLFIQKLGEGGFSYVDLVEGLHDGHFYALKRILCHEQQDREEAQREADMHRLFHHPNILRLVAYCLRERGTKHEAWLLLPFFKRGTLWNEIERLKDKGNFLTEEQILQLLLGICRGLEAIHARGYAHRDLKPTNILLGDEGQPVLMDLGSMNQACIHVEGSRQALALQVKECPGSFALLFPIFSLFSCIPQFGHMSMTCAPRLSCGATVPGLGSPAMYHLLPGPGALLCTEPLCHR
ncbi:serine/threonine-protein kinase 16 isoform X3 [Ailuropoda melanoleuca]|uniref:serine/threonine-protein kinase 16 isoform X3 n=1 Tax=Ailuropoda melanoleuca TaxID=9646 RepID=UPI001493FA13|nr:serine/threonine-protein kinase 16 isoform X3 [Ailuropoda melanoleuca]